MSLSSESATEEQCRRVAEIYGDGVDGAIISIVSGLNGRFTEDISAESSVLHHASFRGDSVEL